MLNPIDQLEYNTERDHLIIPEYGRHLQKMINHAIAQDSRDERNKLAKAIISAQTLGPIVYNVRF